MDINVNDFNGKNPPDLKEILSKMTADAKPIKPSLQEAANQHLLKIKMANNMIGMMAINSKIKSGHADAGKKLQSGEMDKFFAEQSGKLMAITYDEVKEMIEKKYSGNAAGAKKRAETFEKGIAGMSVDEAVNATTALTSIFPSALMPLFLTTLEGMTPAEETKYILSLTTAEKEAYYVEKAAKFPTEAVSHAVYEMLQQATPANLKSAAIDLHAKLTPQRLGALVKATLNFTEDLLSTVKKTNTITLKDAKNGTTLRNELTGVFNDVGASLAKAGITPKTDVTPAFVQAYTGSKGGGGKPGTGNNNRNNGFNT